MVREEIKCRVCDGKLVSLLDFGEIYPSGFVKSQEGLSKAPLVLTQCDKCMLVQLKHTVDLDLMYRQYWYSSALNKSMVSSLEDVAVETLKRQKLNVEDLVIDIGCNDGTLFTFFPDNCYKVGYDPALNLKERAEENCDIFINDYFCSDLLPIGTHKKAKIITSIAMFYDLTDPHDFVTSVVQALSPNGTWVIQLTDLLSMLKINAFDNVCHEHLEYYKLLDLIMLLNFHGLEIYDLEYNKVNGGSLRVYVAYANSRVVRPSVEAALESEKAYFNSFKDPFMAFHKRIKIAEIGLKDFLASAKQDGKHTYLLGASTKGNTLLQVWGFDSSDFEFALEVNEAKFGLRTVGSDIQIIDEKVGLAKNPNHLLLLPWHFSSNMLPKLDSYFNNGGVLITPLPNFAVHYKEDGYRWTLEQKVSVF